MLSKDSVSGIVLIIFSISTAAGIVVLELHGALGTDVLIGLAGTILGYAGHAWGSSQGAGQMLSGVQVPTVSQATPPAQAEKGGTTV